MEISQPEKLHFEISLAEHCNLNCQMCDHFSPLAEKEFLSKDIFEKDIFRMAELFNNITEYIYLLGGEPLLHPSLGLFLKITRKAFPETKICILTNGILLKRQNDLFWETCKNEHVDIYITRYPINLNYYDIIRTSLKKGVSCDFFNMKTQMQRNISLDTAGTQNKQFSFDNCSLKNCVTLKNGRLYTCSLMASVNHFNKFFGMNLELDSQDYIDIYNDVMPDEILSLLRRPVSFCKYCNVMKRDTSHSWKQSSCDITEWVYK